MKIHDQCLPCLVNQVVKVAHMTDAPCKEELYHKVFDYLRTLDFELTNPEVIGQTFRMLKEHVHNDDPYQNIRHYYNRLFLDLRDQFREQINHSDNPMYTAIRYAIVGNIIDFNPVHNQEVEDIMKYFNHCNQLKLEINHVALLEEDLRKAKTLLYLGDNCGEICLDYLLIEKIKDINPHIHIYFATRGAPIVNDSIESDAYFVGMDKYADIISNGDDSLGTILSRASSDFLDVYHQADVVIAKGQANYESLSEENKNIYYLLMTKCEVIAEDIGVPQKSLVCLHR